MLSRFKEDLDLHASILDTQKLKPEFEKGMNPTSLVLYFSKKKA